MNDGCAACRALSWSVTGGAGERLMGSGLSRDDAVSVRPPPLALEHIACAIRYKKSETICLQNEPAAFSYKILDGAACECVLLPDGRRQVIGFLMPGDVFGMWARQTHSFTSEALAESAVARYPRLLLEQLIESDAEVARHVHRLASAAVDRMQWRMALLGKVSALQRVSGFLLQMAERSTARGVDGISLPMSRYDIADYLVLAVETISRTLTQLRIQRIIVTPGARCVRIVNRRALERYSTNDDP
jgi:CRP/FNR family transcriptional regulator, nitrogen fixation regulation protein